MTPTQVLTKLGVPSTLVHMKDRLYVDHLLSVYAGLESWGMPVWVCMAGLLHSIYGTDRFSFWRLTLDQRKNVSDLVGADAELLAYVNCALYRGEFDYKVIFGSDRVISNRFGGVLRFADDMNLLYLYAVQLADWLDQVQITGEWAYRYESYRRMADKLGGPVLATYLWVYRNRARTTGAVE